GAPLLDIRIGLRQVCGVDDREILPLRDAAAELDLELDYTSRNRWHHLHDASRIAFDGVRRHNDAIANARERCLDRGACKLGLRCGARSALEPWRQAIARDAQRDSNQ